MTEFANKNPKNINKLLKAKYEYSEKDFGDDNWIFEKKTVKEVIQGLIENLDQKINAALVELENSKKSLNHSLNKGLNKQEKIIAIYKNEKTLWEETLQKYLNEIPKENHLLNFILKKEAKLQITGSDVYKPVLMSRKTYSLVRCDNSYNPSFETCVQFIFSLKLNIVESTEFLRLAGRAFSNSNYHQIIKFYIENSNYDFFSLNETLVAEEIKPIGCI